MRLKTIITGMRAAGLTAEQILLAIENMEGERTSEKRHKDTMRQKKYRNNNNPVTPVTPVTCDKRDTPPIPPDGFLPDLPSFPPFTPPKKGASKARPPGKRALQEEKPCPPPLEPPRPAKWPGRAPEPKRTDEYFYNGSVIRLKENDYVDWAGEFCYIPYFREELDKLDEYYFYKPPKGGKWWFAVRGGLQAFNAECQAKGLERKLRGRRYTPGYPEYEQRLKEFGR